MIGRDDFPLYISTGEVAIRKSWKVLCWIIMVYKSGRPMNSIISCDRAFRSPGGGGAPALHGYRLGSARNGNREGWTGVLDEQGRGLDFVYCAVSLL